MARLLQFATLVAPAALAVKCPGSKSWVHASCEVSAVAAQTKCEDVRQEMVARAKGHGWVDPHNGGIYTVLSDNKHELNTKRTTNPSRSFGGKVYTDLQTFTLTDTESGCLIEACSESQGFSIGDFSTNYCNIRNLYCGSEEGCTPVTKDFTVHEMRVKPSPGAGSDKSQCIVNRRLLESPVIYP